MEKFRFPHLATKCTKWALPALRNYLLKCCFRWRVVHIDYLQGEIIEFWWTSADDYMQLIVILVRNIFFFPMKQNLPSGKHSQNCSKLWLSLCRGILNCLLIIINSSVLLEKSSVVGKYIGSKTTTFFPQLNEHSTSCLFFWLTPLWSNVHSHFEACLYRRKY